MHSFKVKQNVSGPTHSLNHTLDLIISYGTNPTDIDIILQSDDDTDHCMVTCILRTAEICLLTAVIDQAEQSFQPL